MIERLQTWAAGVLTVGFALGVVVIALFVFIIWGLYDLFTQPDQKM